MKLHRAKKEADWAQVKPVRQNIWQRWAAASRGVITPGNLFTVLGLMLVIVGLAAIIHRDFGFGAVAVIAGRLCDLADGWIAELTGTKSPLGELLDASVDKITTLAIAITLLSTSLVAWWVLLALTLPHVAIAGSAMRAARRNTHLHPSPAGKLSMATTWASLTGIVLVQLLHGSIAHSATVIVYVVLVLSIGLSLYALGGYLKKLA